MLTNISTLETQNNKQVFQAFIRLKEKFDLGEIFVGRNNQQFVESLNESIEFNEPLEPYLDIGIHRSNKKYIEHELVWYLTKERSVEYISKYAKLWKTTADQDGIANSNYGWCIFSKENGLQYQNCLNELKSQPNSRRATMIYTRPSMWKDATQNGRNDFICTNAVQVFIRSNKLYYCIQQRSCDFIYGLFNDYAWHSYIYGRLLSDLDKVKKGKIYYNMSTLHIYSRHFKLFKGNEEIKFFK